MDYETNTARLVMLTLICVVVVIRSDALATSARAVSQLLWKKRKAYSLGIPKTNWLME
jgi:hypothetical protein